MEHLVKETLSGIVPEPLLQDMLRTIIVLYSAGATTFETELKNLMHSRDRVSAEELHYGTLSILHSGLNVVFMEHDIIIEYEDSDLGFKCDLVHALMRLADLQHIEDIEMIINNETLSNDEILAECLHFYMDGDYTIEDVLFKIESVDPNVITNLKDLVEARKVFDGQGGDIDLENHIREHSTVKRCIERTKDYLKIKTVRAERNIVTKLAADGVKPGAPTLSYVNDLIEFLSDIDDEDHNQIAEHTLGLVLYSDNGDTPIRIMAKQLTEMVYDDLTLLSEIDNAILSHPLPDMEVRYD